MLKSSTIPIESKPLRLKDAAEYLGVSNTTIYGYVHMGKLKPLKPGKFLLFTKDSLDRYLKGEPPQNEVDPRGYFSLRNWKNIK